MARRVGETPEQYRQRLGIVANMRSPRYEQAQFRGAELQRRQNAAAATGVVDQATAYETRQRADVIIPSVARRNDAAGAVDTARATHEIPSVARRNDAAGTVDTARATHEIPATAEQRRSEAALNIARSKIVPMEGKKIESEAGHLDAQAGLTQKTADVIIPETANKMKAETGKTQAEIGMTQAQTKAVEENTKRQTRPPEFKNQKDFLLWTLNDPNTSTKDKIAASAALMRGESGTNFSASAADSGNGDAGSAPPSATAETPAGMDAEGRPVFLRNGKYVYQDGTPYTAPKS